MNDPVAIVGMACRFPGGVTDPDSFWELLAAGGDAIREIDRDGLSLERFFDPAPRTAGRMMTRWGGFLDGLDQFDAAFFGISPREASTIDPAQRLLLEATWEACEDATIDPHTLAGQPVGVFVGQWLSDFEARLLADPDEIDFHTTTGSGRYASSGRISFVLGATGPSLTVDTACSSSLVAVHLACQSLRTGESTLAVAAGVNVILQPYISIAYSQSGMMAPDGHCKFGDADGDGYVRSEGVGVVLLKPLAAALADGDPIRGVIRGSAVNNDGRGSGHMATPSRSGQAAMLRSAYAAAGVDPATVGYVEAHGTGTKAGDPVELGALGDVLGTDRPTGRRCLVGSVKTNIGHTEGAAGMAGLIKCVLTLEHGRVPASLHLRQPNPAIPWDDLPFDVPSEAAAWPVADDVARVAGVSAFGITGTNAHVVVEAAPDATTAHDPADEPTIAPLVLPLSAAAPEALDALAAAYADVLDVSDEAGPAALDVCATAARHRGALEHRAVFVAADRGDLVDRLRRFVAGDRSAASAAAVAPTSDAKRIAFVFPGQGGQWRGMARELLEHMPAFGQAIDACDAALPPGTEWSVREQLLADSGDAADRLDEIAVIQPTLLAVEIGLAAVWRSWGIEPGAVVGHSMGEAGAAYFAGALSIADTMRVICRRSELLQRTSGAGAMAMIDLPVAAVEQLIAEHDGRVVVAVSNGPRSTVISGEPDPVAEVLARCERDGVFARAVKVDVASHSPQMDPLVPELVERLAEVAPEPGTNRLYSTVDAAVRPGETLDARYWGRNLREPVMFAATVERMLADGIDAFVELSPHPTLLPSLAQAAADAHQLVAVGSLRRGEPERAAMLAALGALWAGGHPVDWSRQFPTGSYRRVPLPTYPWQRERHWATAAEPVDTDGARRRRVVLDEATSAALHLLRWDAAPLGAAPDPVPNGVAGRWLLVGEHADAAALASELEALGATVELAGSADAAAALVGDPGGTAGDGVSHVLLLPVARPAAFDAVRTIQQLRRAWTRRATDGQAPPRCTWVTTGAHLIAGDAPRDDAAEQAAVWGAARVIAVEHPDWWGGIVDLDPALPIDDQAGALAAHLLSDAGEDQAALRGGARLGLRLVPAPGPRAMPAGPWRSDAAYLITGGLGGVAQHVAMQMVRDGARRLVLMSRSGLPPRTDWEATDPATELGRRIAAVRALEHAGAAVHLVRADVADESQVGAVLAAYAAEGWPPIAGVVHAAGLLDSALTDDLDGERFDAVYRPKLVGAQVLDRLLGDVDVFVVFSSMMAFWPPAGMANYAAANAGLDALVQLRRSRGHHAVSIQWGPWEGVGLIDRADERNVAAFARQGIGSFSPEQGSACFAALVGHDEPVVAVVPIDWPAFRAAHPGRDIALFRAAPGADRGDLTARGGELERLLAASPVERRALLEALVRDVVAGVLRLPAAHLDARRQFGSLGLDSLMALELRDRLEVTLERSLSATLAWNYPSIDALAGHLATLIDADRAAAPTPSVTPLPPAAEPGGTSELSDVVAEVAALTDDDALRALRGGRR